MYDFDAMEAVDDLIDEINEEYASESTEDLYDEIFEELCERVECGELTMEEAEIINEAAAEKYLTEAQSVRSRGKVIMKTVNRNIKTINKQYRSAKTSDDYRKISALCDDTMKNIDELIQEVRECKESNVEKLIWIGRDVIAPMLSAAALTGFVTAASTGKFYDAVIGASAGAVYSGNAVAGGKLLSAVARKKKLNNSGEKVDFAGYKSKILSFLRDEKKSVMKIKKKADSHV